jgi:ATP-dependent Clp protease ATP-binding subunit ClpA
VFERYTESARRTLFFARYEASQLGQLTIEPEHLLLGILREAPQMIARFAARGHVESIRAAIADALPAQEKVSTSVEIPFSRDCKAVLQHAAIEADQLDNHFIGPAHLLVAIVVKTDGAATAALAGIGVNIDAIRDYLRSTPEHERERSVSGPTASSDMSTRLAPGAICRQWRGVVKKGRADEYIRHLKDEALPALRRLPGMLGVLSICRRPVEDGVEFQVTTIWRSLEEIRSFAGDDVTRAVVPPAAQAMMVRYDERAVHYEIVQ